MLERNRFGGQCFYLGDNPDALVISTGSVVPAGCFDKPELNLSFFPQRIEAQVDGFEKKVGAGIDPLIVPGIENYPQRIKIAPHDFSFNDVSVHAWFLIYSSIEGLIPRRLRR